MLTISNLIHGEIVNRHNGRETADGLTLDVCGIARSCDKVTVNGVEATRSGEAFTAPVTLTRQFNDIVVEAIGDRGRATQEITVLWDKASFKRSAFFIDDNSFFLTEIAKTRPASLFDQFYLGMLKRLNERYGLKVTLNLFYRNDHQPFQLNEFPDCYRGEFQDNADWLRLAFHAFSEFPDRPYQNAKPEKMAADYDQIGAEVERFAGPGVYVPPIVCHWAMAQPAAVQELKKRGVKVLHGGFIGLQTYIGEEISDDIPITDIGFFQSEENARFLVQRHMRYDFRHGLTFAYGGDLCCNLNPVPKLQAELARLMADPMLDVLIGMTHEQYFFPSYSNYLPDHAERIETVVRTMSENGYRFVWPNEGFLGNPVVAPQD